MYIKHFVMNLSVSLSYLPMPILYTMLNSDVIERVFGRAVFLAIIKLNLCVNEPRTLITIKTNTHIYIIHKAY